MDLDTNVAPGLGRELGRSWPDDAGPWCYHMNLEYKIQSKAIVLNWDYCQRE